MFFVDRADDITSSVVIVFIDIEDDHASIVFVAVVFLFVYLLFCFI